MQVAGPAESNDADTGDGRRRAMPAMATLASRYARGGDMATRLIWMWLLLPCMAQATEIAGSVSLSTGGRVLLAQESAQAVVYFRPEKRVAPAVPATAFEMRTRGKEFEPRTLVVPVGATVRFPNSDPILHNVFSAVGRNAFDLGLYGRGEGRAQVFAQPGLVRVYCNVHHQMFGYILVLDTPYVARPDAQGRYRLELPRDMSGELLVWHPRAPLWRQRLRISGAAVADAKIELNRPLLPPHNNKFGKPYESHAAHGY